MALKGRVSSGLSGFQANWSGAAPCWKCSRRRPFLLELTGASRTPGGGSCCGHSSAWE